MTKHNRKIKHFQILSETYVHIFEAVQQKIDATFHFFSYFFLKNGKITHCNHCFVGVWNCVN